jgi:hypothetical protein
LTFRRGDKSVEVELSKVQSQLEMWSEELDGENGMIRQFRDDRAERRGAINSLKNLVKIFGAIATVEAVLEGLRLFRLLHY